MSALYKKIRQLPLEERKILAKKIEASIEKDTIRKLRSSLPAKPAGKERWLFIIATAQAVWNVDNLKSNTRKDSYFWARSFAVSQLTKEGCPTDEISHLVNRHRTTTVYLRKRMQELEENPVVDKETYKIYKRFKKLI